MEDFRQKLEKLNPNVTLSVELPHNGNGNLYQARTTIADGLIFYGRGDSEEDAIIKCCQKAVKHLMKNDSTTDQLDNHSQGKYLSRMYIPRIKDFVKESYLDFRSSSFHFLSFSCQLFSCTGKKHILKVIFLQKRDRLAPSSSKFNLKRHQKDVNFR